MKIILLSVIIMLLMSSCSKSVEVNIDILQERINNTFQEEIITENFKTVKKDDEEIIYWLPDKYDICCAFYSDADTGIIKKYTVTGFIDDKNFNLFNQKFFEAISVNNKHINNSTKTAGTLRIVVYEDTRYTESDESKLTLKSSVDVNKITNPSLIETTKPIN